MSTAVQMPLNVGQPTKLGRGLYRKQILPVGKNIEVGGQRLDLTPSLLGRIKATFDSGFLASTPFQLVNGDNGHTDDPERTRGTVRALDLTPDGLYATLDLPDSLLEHNKMLGVSPRLLFGEKRADGRTADVLLRHVAATNDPHIGDMTPFQRIADLAAESNHVVDLTAATYQGDTMALSDEQQAALAAFADQLIQNGSSTAGGNTTPAPTGTAPTASTASGSSQADGSTSPADGELTDDEWAAIEAIANGADGAGSEPADGQTATEPAAVTSEPATAGAALSATGGSVDLAAVVEQQQHELAGVQAQLHRAKWDQRAEQLRRSGVPPYMVDLAAKALAVPAKQIDLAAGDTDPYSVINELLEKCPRLDLSAERGTPTPAENDEVKQGADAWDAEYPVR